jgi:hypothetical protein
MPEDGIRFTVRNNKSLRSATWKCFSSKGKDDFYLACREFRGAMKVSFHKSGKRHIAFDRKFLDREAPNDSPLLVNRFTSQWLEPKELCPGMTLEWRIIIPSWAVNVPIRETDKGHVWIPSPPEGKAIEVSIFLAQPDVRVSSWPGAKAMRAVFVGTFGLASGKKIWIVHRVVEIPATSFPKKARITFFKSSGGEKALTEMGLRGIIVGAEKNGSMYFIEVSIEHADINQKGAQRSE